jgi:HSP20 family molecular chaperone IbpA
MPGVEEKDVSVILKDRVLTIVGQVATDMYA